METLIYDLSAINSKEGATYGFSLSSNVLTPGNKGVNSSFAYAKLTFNMPEKGTLELVVSQSSEKNYDYGLVSNLDTELVKDYNDVTTNVLYSAKGLDGRYTITFEDVPKGEHFITIKYRKDGSQNSGSDTFNIESLTATYEIPIVFDCVLKSPLTLFTSSLKVKGTNLIIEAEEVEIVEELETPDIPTDLTGYKITVPSGWICESDYAYGYFDFTYNGGNYNHIGIGEVQGDIERNSIRIYGNSGDLVLTYNMAFEIYVIGGHTSTANQKLIQWFVDNGATFTKIEEEEVVPTAKILYVTINGENTTAEFEIPNFGITFNEIVPIISTSLIYKLKKIDNEIHVENVYSGQSNVLLDGDGMRVMTYHAIIENAGYYTGLYSSGGSN